MAEGETTRIAPLAGATCAAWTVEVVEGPDRGQTWRVDDLVTRRVLIGAGPACELRLTDSGISRRHAALECDASGLHVVDLDSKNGTWLGKTRVRDVYLSGGETIQLGETKLQFETDGVTKELLLPSTTSFGAVLGMSPQMRGLYSVLERLAKTQLPVLIEGETGTGKQLVAEELHKASARKSGPFVVFDCRPGAAALDRDFVEEAKEGTLFLDEIGDLNIALQVKLLRALEGTSGPRVLAATRRDLDREVQAGRFRDDLFHRLAVTRIELPPLRKREGDIGYLARQFCLAQNGAASKLTSDIGERLEAYDWPGNVRELQNAITQLLELGDFEPVEKKPEPANDFLHGVVTSGMTFPLARDKIVEEFTRRYVEHMLARHGGNVTRAAAASGIGRRYFQMVRGKAG